MTDLFDAPNLFEPASPPPSPAPAQAKPPRPRYVAPAEPDWPVSPPPPRDKRMKPNPGKQPRGSKDKRVVVELNNGKTLGEKPVVDTSKVGWDANTTDWTIDPDWPWAVAFYRIL